MRVVKQSGGVVGRRDRRIYGSIQSGPYGDFNLKRTSSGRKRFANAAGDSMKKGVNVSSWMFGKENPNGY